MGRVTYEGMARHFPTATDPIADVMNQAPKAVFSSPAFTHGVLGLAYRRCR